MGDPKLQNKTVEKQLQRIVADIQSLREDTAALRDAELRDRTVIFKQRLADGETLNSLLPEAYAVVREAARRVLGMEHFPVQLAGGVVLHQGRVAEMRTGEGKTLVATLPAYLNALEGKGVHIVTVNDYLAKRDREQMGRVHEFLGLRTGVVLSGMKRSERQAAYQCDVTYITNHELGFDYLRDNMVMRAEDLVQRGLHYVIIDEVDSVLIDEARTPLIISGEGKRSTRLYQTCDFLAGRMKRGADLKRMSTLDLISGAWQEETGEYIVDEKEKRAFLTEAGVRRVERFFRLENLSDPRNVEIMRHMNLALRAKELMIRDRDYVVRDGKVLIVDGFTGRAMEGRRYSEGLHQAIEAKEHVRVQKENNTIATITYQNFFNKYDKKAGMTGTGKTEERELQEVYGLDVVEIPTNRPVIRVDQPDVVYRTRREKLDAVCQAVEACGETGRPVLVGTVSVEASEELSGMLSERGIVHNVLNAKQHEREAAIVAEAGRKGAVTIATNMAGRGTDIKLDTRARMAGGLLVIGTERHESRRIDGQLRGRSGRQGDPGESRFILSLEDSLLRLFGQERLNAVFDSIQVSEGEGVISPAMSKAVERAQRRMESEHFAMRSRLLEYDQVMNEQREVVYSQRRQVLMAGNIQDIIAKMTRQAVTAAAAAEQGEPADVEELVQDALDVLEAAGQSFPDRAELEEFERSTLLRTVDQYWMAHIDALDQLRQGVGLVGYAQRDPVTEYKRAAYDLFEEMNRGIRRDTVAAILALAEDGGEDETDERE